MYSRDDFKLFARTDKGLEGLLHNVRVFIGMNFAIDECPMLVMKSRKVRTVESIALPDGKEIQELGEGGRYRYLGILEMDRVRHEKLKKSLCKEYFG